MANGNKKKNFSGASTSKTKGASASGDPKGKVRSLRARERVVKGGTRMSNKPDYEGINFKNKDIDRISSGTRKVLAKRTTHVPEYKP